jgi:hypothetical protein
MPAPTPPVPSDEALAVLTEWDNNTTRGIAELTGDQDSSRTRTLLRLHEGNPAATFVDATGLTSEDVVVRVMAAAGHDMPVERRADWGRALRNSAFAGSTVIIANAQRAGRTRRSSEPDRLVHRFAVSLAVEGRGRLKVVVERNSTDTRRWHRNLVANLQPGTAPDVVRSVNLRLVSWLREQDVTGDIGRYLAQGLAMHAIQAGQFDAVQRAGRTVAHLDQTALIDAALGDDRGRIDGDSPAGDAVTLWNAGVDSLPPGE